MNLRAVARRADLWEGEMARVDVDGTPVLLVNVGGSVRAYHDRCPHLGVALSCGRLAGGVLTCGAHGWCYDAHTGRGLNPRGVALRPVAIAIQGEEVCVEMPITSDVAGEGARNGERVGPVLQGGAAAEAVVAAIRSLNRQVEVLDRGSYLRVLVPGRCLVTRAAIEAELRAPFRLRSDLERVMPSFKGRLSLSDEEACWEAR
jgi:toluene monooxygenase system ferredoxin subunit